MSGGKKNKMQGEIFNIQKFCVNDGPGIRTTVFLKGCMLRCVWCHNPESQKPVKEIMFYSDKCVFCGKCKDLTPDDTEFYCVNEAKEICGKTVSSDEVIKEVMKDYEFYKNSGGGITLSGGEPLFQFEFALEILQKAKENNLHTALETCGFAEKEKIVRIAEFTDLFLFDFKESRAELHKEYTGVDNALIMENLSLLNEMKKDIILRCPIIPVYNARKENYDKISSLANDYASIKSVEIEPYHSFGENKYTALGIKEPKISSMSDKQIDEIIDYISSQTDKPVTRA